MVQAGLHHATVRHGLAAIVLSAAVGFIAPGVGASLQPLGDGWIALIRMLIGPVIFCAIVTGIASAGRLAGVGRIGIKAIVYFEVITMVALLIGLIVMNVLHPGAGIHANPADVKISGSATKYVSTAQNQHWYSFLVNIIPSTVVSAFVNANVLQVLLVAVLFAISLRALGDQAAPVARGVAVIGDVFFDMVRLVLYLAPIGAFGAMAYATGAYGLSTLTSVAYMVGLFWGTGIVFCVVVLGVVARLVGLRVLRLYRYFKDELLITLGTLQLRGRDAPADHQAGAVGLPPAHRQPGGACRVRLQLRRRLPVPRLRRTVHRAGLRHRAVDLCPPPG